jgi:hypothetical protein
MRQFTLRSQPGAFSFFGRRRWMTVRKVEATKRPFRQPSGIDSGGIRIVSRQIAELELDPRNPRAHSPGQIRQIARSIEAFGFNVPVLVDAKRKVIAGHGRIMACKLLGWSEVPTIALEHLSEAQAKAFMIADNRLTENSVWDDRLLAEQLKALAILSRRVLISSSGRRSMKSATSSLLSNLRSPP